MKKILFIIAIFFAIPSIAQDGKIFFETNHNTFSHSNLSDFQQEFVSDLPEELPIATTDDFPANIGFTLGYEFVDRNTSFFISYNATGGKLSYTDFSGVIRLEQQLRGVTFGGVYLLNLDEEAHFKLGFRGLITFSSLNIDSYFELQNNIDQDELSFSSTDLGLGISLIYEYPVSFFVVRAQIGFDAVFGGKLYFDNIDNAHLINNSGEDVKTGWSGFRSGLGIAIPVF